MFKLLFFLSTFLSCQSYIFSNLWFRSLIFTIYSLLVQSVSLRRFNNSVRSTCLACCHSSRCYMLRLLVPLLIFVFFMFCKDFLNFSVSSFIVDFISLIHLMQLVLYISEFHFCLYFLNRISTIGKNKKSESMDGLLFSVENVYIFYWWKILW